MTDISSDDHMRQTADGDSSALTLRKAAHELALAAPIILGGSLAVGLALALGVVMLLGPAFALISLALVLGSGLVGWMLARLVRAGTNAFEAWAEQVERAEVAERHVISALGRVATALERSTAIGPAAAPVSSDPLAEIRKAIKEARWEHAGSLIQEFHETHPDSPAGPRLDREFESAREEEVRGLHTKLAAAREVSDPDRVLELRDALRALLDAEGLQALDQELTRWLMALIQKRLRAGTIRVDVVELAAKVAERFDHTSEGASLRAALPTLRRSAGLCARCGKPYTGIADACPVCLTTQSFPAFAADVAPEPTEDDDLDQVFQSDKSV